MLKQCLEVFGEMYDNNPNIIMRGYIPKDGRYIIVKMNENSDWEVISDIDIQYDKKTKDVIGSGEEHYSLTKRLDYYSNLLEMNKPIDPKKAIHSSNYYSFSFKKAIINTKIDEEAIKRYFDILKNPELKYKDKNSKILYKSNEEKLGAVDIKEIEKIESWIIDNLSRFEIDEKEKDYFKILFVYSDENNKQKIDQERTLAAFKREQTRYEGTNVFNSNKYNIIKDETVYGLSNNNMGLNSKKPYLANLSRNIAEPYLISVDEAMLQKLFFDYLQSEVSNKNYTLFIDTDNKMISNDKSPQIGIELKLMPDRNEVSIIGYRKIVSNKSKLDITIKKHIIPKIWDEKYMDNKNEKNSLEKDLYKRHTDRTSFFHLIDSVYFYKFLLNNQEKLEEVDIKESLRKQILIKYGYSVINWKVYNKTKSIQQVLRRLIIDSIKFSISHGYKRKAVQQFNMGVSLQEYFGLAKEEEVLIIRERVREKILSKESYSFDSDAEALFAIGQAMSYLLSQTRAKNKDMTFIQNMLNKKDGNKIINELTRVVKKYKYIFESSNHRSNTLVSMLLQYEFESHKKVDEKWLLAGFLDECFIFVKAK